MNFLMNILRYFDTINKFSEELFSELLRFKFEF